jgi:hypothetical protein
LWPRTFIRLSVLVYDTTCDHRSSWNGTGWPSAGMGQRHKSNPPLCRVPGNYWPVDIKIRVIDDRNGATLSEIWVPRGFYMAFHRTLGYYKVLYRTIIIPRV